MELHIPEEPVVIKEYIRFAKKEFDKIFRKSRSAERLAVWRLEGLPKYLWGEWKSKLKKMGITWRDFLKILRHHILDMIRWAIYDSLSWEELIRQIEESIKHFIELGEIY